MLVYPREVLQNHNPLDRPEGRLVIFNVRHRMKTLVLTLDPGKLENPDLDLRYAIPDLLAERSGGNIKDNGYDYENQENPNSPLLAIFLTTTDLASAIKKISQLLLNEEVLGNQLSSAAALYIEENGSRTPISFTESHA